MAMLLLVYLKLWCHFVFLNNIIMYSKSVQCSLKPM